jgi:hypothetical protein
LWTHRTPEVCRETGAEERLFVAPSATPRCAFLAGRRLPHIREDVHPLAVVTWFAIPHPDLVMGKDETPVTPLQWLRGGGSVDAVAEQAKAI